MHQLLINTNSIAWGILNIHLNFVFSDLELQNMSIKSKICMFPKGKMYLKYNLKKTV